MVAPLKSVPCHFNLWQRLILMEDDRTEKSLLRSRFQYIFFVCLVAFCFFKSAIRLFSVDLKKKKALN